MHSAKAPRTVQLWAEATRRKAVDWGYSEPLSIVGASWMHFVLKGLHFDPHTLPHLREKLALLVLQEQLVLVVPQ